MRRLVVLSVLALFAGAAEARPLKGDGPTTIATGYGAVWIGFGNGTVLRIDERTLERRSVRLGTAGRAYILSFAMGFGSIWVMPSGLQAHRLDPRTGGVQATIGNQPGTWSGTPAQVAVGAGHAWVADHERDAVLRVDVWSNRVDRRTAVPGRVRSVAAGEAVWVQTVPQAGPVMGPEGMRIVHRLDPRTMRLRLAFRTRCDSTLLPAGRVLWILDSCDGSLRRFDSRSEHLTGRIAPAGALGLSAGFGSIWVSSGWTVRRLRGGQRIAAIQAKGLAAAGGRYVWVLDYGDGASGWLRRIDPRTNRVIGRAIRLSTR